MAFRTIEIQQALASVEAKLSTAAYSTYLKRLYGMMHTCSTTVFRLLLLQFAISNWDNRPGATNPFTEAQLSNLIRQVNKL
jgi:hypothetical protein